MVMAWTLRCHAIQRAKERFNIDLTEQDIIDFSEKIRNGEFKCVGRVSGRRTLWLIQLNYRNVVALYNNDRKTIVTFVQEDYHWTLKHGDARKRQRDRKKKRLEKREQRHRRRLRCIG